MLGKPVGGVVVEELTPPQIVKELDRYVIAQDDAKKAVAIALRNRVRRMRVEGDIKEEISPKNIIMIGPTGVGKTEISRRLAKLTNAPFVKVEASKFTEVGYVGRDVESIIRDLVEVAFKLVREEERERVVGEAEKEAEESLLGLLLPSHSVNHSVSNSVGNNVGNNAGGGLSSKDADDPSQLTGGPVGLSAAGNGTRDKLRELLRQGKLEDRVVELEVSRPVNTHLEIVGPHGFGEIEGQLKEMFSNMIPRSRDRKKLPVKEARKILIAEAQEKLVDTEKTTQIAVERVEQSGIVFIDEIDKICGGVNSSRGGPDVSREGVQRDLLPIVEGCSVSTKYGMVRTDHILFIASGAFHTSRPSDLIPEFQGRFPIRVELNSLTKEHFVRILTEPRNALVKQYIALLKTENVEIEFGSDAIEELASLTEDVNGRTENIGARRLHTLMEKVLEDLSFTAHEYAGQKIHIDREFVTKKLASVVKDEDLSRFIL